MVGAGTPSFIICSETSILASSHSPLFIKFWRSWAPPSTKTELMLRLNNSFKIDCRLLSSKSIFTYSIFVLLLLSVSVNSIVCTLPGRTAGFHRNKKVFPGYWFGYIHDKCRSLQSGQGIFPEWAFANLRKSLIRVANLQKGWQPFCNPLVLFEGLQPFLIHKLST